MISIPVTLLRTRSREVVGANLLLDLQPRTLAEVEQEWGQIRRDAIRRLLKADYPAEEIPRHFHWDWEAKGQKLSLLFYRCFGIECEGRVQGLMMVDVASKFARLPPDEGKPLVYVDYLEVAPWNVNPLTNDPVFSGIGLQLMKAAVQLSINEGFQGRVGLHALFQAESFYRDKCSMKYSDKDQHPEGLPYYEFTCEAANCFVSN